VRLPFPIDLPENLAPLLTRCIDFDSKNRPDFVSIKSEIQKAAMSRANENWPDLRKQWKAQKYAFTIEKQLQDHVRLPVAEPLQPPRIAQLIQPCEVVPIQLPSQSHENLTSENIAISTASSSASVTSSNKIERKLVKSLVSAWDGYLGSVPRQGSFLNS
jgi:hypothetical protein